MQFRFKYIFKREIELQCQQAAIWYVQLPKAFLPTVMLSQGAAVFKLGPYLFIFQIQYRTFLLFTIEREKIW